MLGSCVDICACHRILRSMFSSDSLDRLVGGAAFVRPSRLKARGSSRSSKSKKSLLTMRQSTPIFPNLQ